MKKHVFLAIIMIFLTLTIGLISTYLNKASAQNNNSSYNQENMIINISGYWTAEIASGNVNLQINQNGRNFTWGLEYVDQGLTAEGTGIIENRTLLVETGVAGRMAPSTGQIVNVNNNGYAISIELDDMFFTRTGE